MGGPNKIRGVEKNREIDKQRDVYLVPESKECPVLNNALLCSQTKNYSSPQQLTSHYNQNDESFFIAIAFKFYIQVSGPFFN